MVAINPQGYLGATAAVDEFITDSTRSFIKPFVNVQTGLPMIKRLKFFRLILASALVSVLTLSSAAPGSPSVGQQGRCRSGQLHLVVDTQGENTTAWISVGVRMTGPSCSSSGVVKLTIALSGKRAEIRGNPLSRRIQGVFNHRQTTVVRADWSNWCRSREGVRLRVSFGDLITVEPFSVLPVCLSPKSPSRLSLIK